MTNEENIRCVFCQYNYQGDCICKEEIKPCYSIIFNKVEQENENNH